MNAHDPVTQASALAHPDRVRLLALALTAPQGHITLDDLLRGASTTEGPADVEALQTCGLLERVDLAGGTPAVRPTHDALARFGALIVAGSGGTAALPDDAIDRLAAPLVVRFSGILAAETVTAFVADSHRLLAQRARIGTYLAVLTERFALERLEALARADLGPARRGLDVLFVCSHNAGRSQLAAAALRVRVDARVRVHTAGSRPAARVDPAVAAVIARRGWSAALDFPKPLTVEFVRAADYVITMGCGDACPVLPGRRYADWDLADPAGQGTEVVEQIADEVERRVSDLCTMLAAQLRSQRGSGAHP